MITVNKNPARPSATYLVDGVDRTNQLFQIDPARRIAKGFVITPGTPGPVSKGRVLVFQGEPLKFTRRYRTLEIISKATGTVIDPESMKDTLP